MASIWSMALPIGVEETMNQLGHDDMRQTLRYVSTDVSARKKVLADLAGKY
jgi:uncharacterized caspase-like protein